MKIFVDANVLFTAAYSSTGKAAVLLEYPGLFVITSEYAANEARRNILVKRPAAVERLDKILQKIEIVPSIRVGNCPLPLPAKDQPIFLSALKARATHLLTGDLKDFGSYMNQPQSTAGIVIQTVADFLALL